jgi:5-methyltetrahydrofolate--homocysteine methyltransferase
MGTMLAGQSAEALAISLHHRDLLYIGLNCATGPAFMTDHLRALHELSPWPIVCAPNAGLPDEDGRYLESPQLMSQILRSFGEKGWLNGLGGCCGTTVNHIKAFRALADELKPRALVSLHGRSLLSGVDWLEVSEDVRPVLVGERTNVIGSRLFRQLIVDEKFDEASDIARRQIKNQAQIIDVCLANPDRDELEDMEMFLEPLIKKVAVPLMIDSTDEVVIAKALTYCQGKAIVNSINLEDGEERFEKICPLLKRFGAAVVVGCIDDDPQQGMGVSVERKLEIARRSYDLLTEKYGLRAEDIYWDALVFPCGTGDENYLGSAAATIEGVRALKKEFPLCKTVLGISNVSFGLPTAGREVLNSVFLYHCTKAGLDLAIVNSEKLERFAEISDEERLLCDDLIWNRGDNPVAAFNAHFGSKKVTDRKPRENLSLDERLSRYIVEGSRDGLINDLELARQQSKPLDIINGPLMAGMDEVGRLFNDNKLIVAEVLQSAESMKAAVNYLKPFMETSETSLRGRVILATVKGDVHDIGKNLVEIILSNNGFEVINLGIKIPSQALIEAAQKHQPDIIGLSGLLVKSAQQMVETAGDLAAAGVKTPILVGGAALSRQFVDRKIAPAYTTGDVEYAQDAMDGLDLAKQLVSDDQRKALMDRIRDRRAKLPERKVVSLSVVDSIPDRSPRVTPQDQPPRPPSFDRRVVTLPLDQVWNFVNPLMLYGKHLGLKGNHIRAFSDEAMARELKDDSGFKKALELKEIVEEVKEEARAWMEAKAVYQFFPAAGDKNDLVLFGPDLRSELVRWNFKRQTSGDFYCLSDLVSPFQKGAATDDTVALFVTTARGSVAEQAQAWKDSHQYLKSHALLSLALETAEAAAEMIHSQLRAVWGFPDHPDMKMMERFQARYRGKRYSFGYPACPELDYQQQLFQVLQPQQIGVELTEGFMMSPESSVSALVFSHPDAVYFGVSGNN